MNAARAAFFLAAVMLFAATASAATVAVAPIHDAGEHRQGNIIRRQIEDGLAGGGLTVVGAVQLSALAKKQGLPTDALDQPPVLMPVAKSAGAQAVFTARIQAKGRRDQVLDVRVFNLEGVELWSRPIPITRGKLAPRIPEKIARAVTAAIANATPAAPPPSDGTAAGDDTGSSDTTASGDDTGSSDTAASSNPTAPSNDTAPPPTKPAQTQSDDDTAIVSPHRRPVAHSDDTSTGDGDDAISGPPTEPKADDAQPAPPYIDVGVGFTLVSRSYKLCPGVTSCSKAGPTPTVGDDGYPKDAPIAYSTKAPSSALLLHLEVFPVPKLIRLGRSATLTFGVIGEYLHGFSVTNSYLDDAGQPAKFNSSISRITADVVGRIYFHALGGTGYAGVYGGVLLPKFAIDLPWPSPYLAPSGRKGFDLGVGGELPLAADYVKVRLQLGLAPAANPGVDETTDYGQTGTGGGQRLRAGLFGEYKFIGYGLFADVDHYADTFDGAGIFTTNGAVSTETYVTYSFMLRGRF